MLAPKSYRIIPIKNNNKKYIKLTFIIIDEYFEVDLAVRHLSYNIKHNNSRNFHFW